jgi:hypothetical protein
MFANQAIVADYLAHNSSILLFYKTLIILQIRATPRERHVFLFTIGDHCLVDEFSTVIGINSQNGKWEERACALEGSQHRLLAPMHERQAFRPAGCYVRERQGIQVSTVDVCATMSHQVRFQKAGSGLMPPLERADQDLLLEQSFGSRRGEAPLTSFALGTRASDPLWLRSLRAVGSDTPR